MLKSDLINRLVRELPHLRRPEVERCVEALLSSFQQALSKGQRIELRGFGSFSPRHRPTRPPTVRRGGPSQRDHRPRIVSRLP